MKKIEIPYIQSSKSKLVNLDLAYFEKYLPFIAQHRYVISFPPEQIGGNHRHPRTEAFIGIGDELELVWQDNDGLTHREKMAKKEDVIILFILPTAVPHAVVNRSKTSSATLIEWADGEQIAVEKVILE